MCLLCCRYDPVDPMSPAETVIEKDRELLEDFYGLEEDVNYNVLTPWLLRLILDDRLTVDKKLGMGQIAEKLKDEFEVGLVVLAAWWMRQPAVGIALACLDGAVYCYASALHLDFGGAAVMLMGHDAVRSQQQCRVAIRKQVPELPLPVVLLAGPAGCDCC